MRTLPVLFKTNRTIKFVRQFFNCVCFSREVTFFGTDSPSTCLNAEQTTVSPKHGNEDVMKREEQGRDTEGRHKFRCATCKRGKRAREQYNTRVAANAGKPATVSYR